MSALQCEKNTIIQNSHSATNRLSEINTCTNALTVTRGSEIYIFLNIAFFFFNQITVTQVSCDQTVMRACSHSWVQGIEYGSLD